MWEHHVVKTMIYDFDTSDNLLPYWIEPGYTSSSAIVWVNVLPNCLYQYCFAIWKE